MRSRKLAPEVAFLLACSCLSIDRLAAQGFSGLEGKSLEPASGLEEGVRGVLGELLGAQGDGRLEKVVVVEDHEGRLVVSVSYRDLAGRQLLGELRGRDRKEQRGFSRPVVALDQASGDVQLVFVLEGDLPEGSTVESAYLRLKVLQPKLPVPAMERTFALRKRWLAVTAAEKVVRVTPRPEGAAAQLGERGGPVALPPVRALPTDAVVEGLAARELILMRAAPVAEAASPAAEMRSTQVQMQVATRTAPALEGLGASRGLVLVNRFDFGLNQGIVESDGKGPGPVTFDLLEGLRADVPLSRDRLLRVSTRVFQDQNAASGIFYFMPRAYIVEWTPDAGYGLRMLYGAAAGGEAGEVMMAARLDAGVDTEEIELATALLRAYQARHPGQTFSGLVPLPLEKVPDVSLAGDLAHQYDIPAEKIVVNAISNVLGEVDVSWVTDTVTKENLQLALVEEVGLNGNLSFQPAGGGLPPQAIPVQIRLADAQTLGSIYWRRGQPWTNDRPYPVRLRYLHALLIDQQTPIVYSWNLENATVPPKAKAAIDGATVPSWLDGLAARLWIEYAPVASCEPCDQEVIAAITGGVTSLGSSSIVFHTITPLADLGVYELSVTVRSRYFDPRSHQLQTKPVLALPADNKDYSVGPIYLVNRQPGESVPGDPLFEYLLAVSMPDGTTHEAKRWIPADGLRILIGKVQVERALGSLPGTSEDPP